MDLPNFNTKCSGIRAARELNIDLETPFDYWVVYNYSLKKYNDWKKSCSTSHKGQVPAIKGKKLSEASKQKVSAGLKKYYSKNPKVVTPEFCEKMRNIAKQRIMSKTGWWSDTAREHYYESIKLIDRKPWNKGKKMSQEHYKNYLLGIKNRQPKKGKFIVDGLDFDSSWECIFYLAMTAAYRDDKGCLINPPQIKRNVKVDLPSGSHYFIDFEINEKLFEVKNPYFFNDDGQMITPYGNPTKAQDKHSKEKEEFISNNAVTLITDISPYKQLLDLIYCPHFVDLFNMKDEFPYEEPIWQCHKKNKMSPFEAYYNPTIRQKMIFNRLLYGPFGKNESKNWSNEVFSPKQNRIYPRNVVQALTITKTAPKVSELKEKDVLIFDNVQSVINPFAGFGACYRVCQKRNILCRSIDIQQMFDEVEIKNVLEDKDDFLYDELFACPPYSDKEQWLVEMPAIKTCDEWVEFCLNNYKAKRYVFIVDSTEKYKSHISSFKSNKNHLNKSSQELVLVF